MSLLKGAVLLGLLVPASLAGAQESADEEEILRIHESVLESHRQGDLPSWMAHESEEYLSVNGGRVTFPSSDDRRRRRGPYLESTSFSMYQDLRPPVVRVSDDGTLGWLAAEVEIRGVSRSASGEETPFHSIWAWVALFEKGPDGWRVVGNASNLRPETDGS